MRLFSMGVPVIASLNGAFTALAHWWTLDLWFLANWASSSTSPDQRPAEYASVSRRKRAYDVTTISAPSTSVARSVLLRRRVSVMPAVWRFGANCATSAFQLETPRVGATIRKGGAAGLSSLSAPILAR